MTSHLLEDKYYQRICTLYKHLHVICDVVNSQNNIKYKTNVEIICYKCCEGPYVTSGKFFEHVKYVATLKFI